MITVLIEGMRLESEANKRDKWGAIKRAKEQRGIVGLSLQQHNATLKNVLYAGKPGYSWLATDLTVTVARIAPRPLDDDNLARSCKATRDSIADWLGIDDRDERVSWRYEQRKDKRAHYYGVEIRIEARKHCEACGQVVTEEVA